MTPQRRVYSRKVLGEFGVPKAAREKLKSVRGKSAKEANGVSFAARWSTAA